MLYVGISTLHLPQSSFTQVANGGTAGDAGQLDFEQARHYYIMAGYQHDISMAHALCFIYLQDY